MRHPKAPRVIAVLLIIAVILVVLVIWLRARSSAGTLVPRTPAIPATSLAAVISADKRTEAQDVVIAKATPTPIPPGKPAPVFALEGLDGKVHRLEEYRGKQIVLNFWATWCIPCRLEMPLLDATYRRLAGSGLVVIGINFGEDHTAVQQYVEELKLSFPILVDEAGVAARAYGVVGLPTTFFVDPAGILRDRVVGPLTAESLQGYLDRLAAVDAP
jgi:peroxiredoxin